MREAALDVVVVGLPGRKDSFGCAGAADSGGRLRARLLGGGFAGEMPAGSQEARRRALVCAFVVAARAGGARAGAGGGGEGESRSAAAVVVDSAADVDMRPSSCRVSACASFSLSSWCARSLFIWSVLVG